jgi:hypothetical protein
MTTIVRAACACGSFNSQFEIPNSSLPFERAICLCNSDRRLTGTCGSSYIRIADQIIDPSKHNLTAYKSRKAWNHYFCSTCGAHVFTNRVEDGLCILATGLLERTEGIVNWNGCKWVEDTLDGGISVWLNDIIDADGTKRKLGRWRLNDKGGELVPADSFKKLPPQEKEAGERLEAQCHCGGVKFYVTRPNDASKEARSPFPDLMIPYHLDSSANPENKTWWLRDNDTKYLAGTCACNSCRLALGFEIQTWAFIPRCNIVQEDGLPLDFKMGTLKRYESSKEVWREFCGVCGATVFWHCAWRPELIDVSIGLFDPHEGARVERWLDWWTGRVSFSEMAISKSLIASLEEGLNNWKGGAQKELSLKDKEKV